MLVVAATGHRPPKLGGYGALVHKRLVTLAREYLREVRPDYAIQGMALGWDQAFGWACVKEGVPFTAAVPFAGQDSTWPDEGRALYRDLLREAAHVEYVCSPGYAPWKMQKRNEWMVDRCGRLATLWDGTPGGTANCIKYAEKARAKTGAPVVDNLWARWSRE